MKFYTGDYKGFYREEGNARFVLRTIGDRPLVCFGINPATANKKESDQTVRKVMGFAERKGYDGIIMLNLYPLRSTDMNGENGLPWKEDDSLIQKNAEYIKEAFEKLSAEIGEITIWAGWGVLYEERPYFRKCLRKIAEAVSKFNCQWKAAGFTKAGHPRHPLYLSFNAKLSDFDIEDI